MNMTYSPSLGGVQQCAAGSASILAEDLAFQTSLDQDRRVPGQKLLQISQLENIDDKPLQYFAPSPLLQVKAYVELL